MVGNLKINYKLLKTSKIIQLILILIVVYIAVFLMPNHIEKLALIKDKFFSGEYWRLLTFQFSHLNIQHLGTNIFSAVIVGFLATEVKAKFDDFTIVYFLAGIIAVLPFIWNMNFTALGASASIYGAFGLVALNSQKWKINPAYVYAILIIAIFMESLIYYFSCGANCEKFLFTSKQGVLHFSGLVSGSVLFFSLTKIRQSFDKKKSFALRRLK